MPLVARREEELLFVNTPEPLAVNDVCGIGRAQGATHVLDGLCTGSRFLDVKARVVEVLGCRVVDEKVRSFSYVDFLGGLARLARFAADTVAVGGHLPPEAPPGPPVRDFDALIRYLAAEELGLMPYEDRDAVQRAAVRRRELQAQAAAADAGVAAIASALGA